TRVIKYIAAGSADRSALHYISALRRIRLIRTGCRHWWAWCWQIGESCLCLERLSGAGIKSDHSAVEDACPGIVSQQHQRLGHVEIRDDVGGVDRKAALEAERRGLHIARLQQAERRLEQLAR